MGQKQLKAARRRERQAPPPWDQFQEAQSLTLPSGESAPIPSDYKIYRNSRYQVWVRKVKPHDERWPEIAWLSIKRNDRQPIHDWRDLQRIKNELVGPEFEAVELYPAESRLVDGANQYHLWIPLDPAFRFPFGFNERMISEASKYGETQRPFEPGSRPADCDSLTDRQKTQFAVARMVGRMADGGN